MKKQRSKSKSVPKSDSGSKPKSKSKSDSGAKRKSKSKGKSKPRKARSNVAEPLVIGGVAIAPGEIAHLDLEVARLPTYTKMALPIVVRHGVTPGPCLWVNAATHGDEINGVEIIHRVLEALAGEEPTVGTLLAIPIVNVFGFIHQSRYLPDGRDLNRSFPGSNKGSLASRVARLLMDEIVENCTHGIDLHTATNHRTNHPQIRADLENAETLAFAEAFAAPVTIHSKLRDGSLRSATADQGVPMLVYEAGEAHRFDDFAIESGIQGVLRAMTYLGMRKEPASASATKTRISRTSNWVRASRGGLLKLTIALGDELVKGQDIGIIGDPFGGERVMMKSRYAGVVIGMTRNPVVYQGDAIAHIAS